MIRFNFLNAHIARKGLSSNDNGLRFLKSQDAIFVSACEIALASLVNRTRKLFPAVVSGVVIMVVGLELGKIAAGVLLEHTAAHSEQTVRLSRPPSAHLP